MTLIVAPGVAVPLITPWPPASDAYTRSCQKMLRAGLPLKRAVCVAVDVGPGVPVKSAVVQLR